VAPTPPPTPPPTPTPPPDETDEPDPVIPNPTPTPTPGPPGEEVDEPIEPIPTQKPSENNTDTDFLTIFFISIGVLTVLSLAGMRMKKSAQDKLKKKIQAQEEMMWDQLDNEDGQNNNPRPSKIGNARKSSAKTSPYTDPEQINVEDHLGQEEEFRQAQANSFFGNTAKNIGKSEKARANPVHSDAPRAKAAMKEPKTRKERQQGGMKKGWRNLKIMAKTNFINAKTGPKTQKSSFKTSKSFKFLHKLFFNFLLGWEADYEDYVPPAANEFFGSPPPASERRASAPSAAEAGFYNSKRDFDEQGIPRGPASQKARGAGATPTSPPTAGGTPPPKGASKPKRKKERLEKIFRTRF